MDGTANLKTEVPDAIEHHVWVQPGDDQEWLAGGSFLVAGLFFLAYVRDPVTQYVPLQTRLASNNALSGGY